MVNIPLPNNQNQGSNQSLPNKRYEKSALRDFENQPDLIPPQNLEAEEAVIGGILLDPDAISRIGDLVQPEAFYLNAHRQIFKTALMLHSQGKPTDLTAMSAWLADTGELEAIGGNIKYTLYPDAYHDSWTRTYENDNLYEWLLNHTKIN